MLSESSISTADGSPGIPRAGLAAKLPVIPAAAFGMVLGLAGLANAWRAAHDAYQLPAAVGEAIMAAAAAVWAILLCLYAFKWWLTPRLAIAELHHPVQCCFVGLIGVATMLVAIGALPYDRTVGVALFAAGSLFTAGFAIWRTGLLWQGGRQDSDTTAVLYLPTVAGFFVTGTTAAALGRPDWGQLAFGAGLFSWFAIESILVHRLFTAPSLLPALRPTLGIQMAPPVVGAVCYVSVTSGPPDIFIHALIGYGLLQSLFLLRLLPWIFRQPFAASYWAFTFGATSLAAAPLRMVARGAEGPLAALAPILLAAATALVAAIALGSLWLLLRGRLFPRPTTASPK
ncbi:dicarboxylate transporter/tellurite-resistance protein TehA [Pelagibius sp. 7325]|uniref:dicarboxylate transporter/tellurite-resistance protein TehA n=1 Tax=Pelagibius sp. 7325 TaxID=3131994 RepID=UPI0030EC61EC